MWLKAQQIQKHFIFSAIFTLLLQLCYRDVSGAATLTRHKQYTSDTIVTDSAENGHRMPNACDADYWPRQLHIMRSHVDELTKPCDDFYEYACGNWRLPYELRAHQARDTLTAVKASNKQQLLNYLLTKQEALQNGTRLVLAPGEEAVVRFFSTCLSIERSDSGGRLNLGATAATLSKYTDELRGISEWPVLNADWLATPANNSLSWTTYLSTELRRYGVQALWQLKVSANWQQSEQQIFYIIPPAFDLLKPTRQSDYYDRDSEYVYKRYVKYLMLDLGVRVRHAQQIANEVVEFKKKLFELVSGEILRAPQTLDTLQMQLPELNFCRYFAALLREFSADLPADYEHRLLIVADVPYLRKLSALLAHTAPELIGKYLLVQFLAHFEVRLHDGESDQEQRDQCLQQLDTFFPAQFTQMFLHMQHADDVSAFKRTQSELISIFAQLKRQFERMLNATNVFERDAPTKTLGLEKVRAMRLLLPQADAPEANCSPTRIQLTDSYDDNLMKLWQWRTRQQLCEILETLRTGRSTPQAYSSHGPLDVNAYYRLTKNAIELPIGIVRTPFYHSCLHPAKVYGSFVYIISHELLHGFDYDGFNYDKSGNIASDWGVKAIVKFGSKSGCYLNGRYADAELALNENIADSEGLRLALETYRDVGGANAKLSVEQLKLFFLSFAQTWCGKGAATGNGEHYGHRERVNNVVGNFAEFAEAYQCQTASDMNPADKCRIW